MINHFIFIKYQDTTLHSHIDEFCTRMVTLPNEILEIASMEVGLDILHDQRSWDLELVMQFVNVYGLRFYQQHPSYQAAVTSNQTFVADLASIDYEAPFSK